MSDKFLKGAQPSTPTKRLPTVQGTGLLYDAEGQLFSHGDKALNLPDGNYKFTQEVLVTDGNTKAINHNLAKKNFY